MKNRPVKAELFDAVWHDEACSHFAQFWERAENIPEKTYVKPLPNTIHNSMEMARFYNCTSIYQLLLQWAYSINRIEPCLIKDNNRLKYNYIYICKYVSMYVYIYIYIYIYISK